MLFFTIMITKKSHIHFVGIGGIGMSGLATILKQSGYTVSGCDPDIKQDTVIKLQQLGCAVHEGNNAPACNDATIDTLIYIPMYATTIPAVMAEIERAQKNNIITLSRAQLLAQLMHSKYSIAVAGSHGKTTTTSLISHLLIEANLDPTIVVGGQLKNIGSNARMGNGTFLVAEADESDRSFLEFHPNIAVITNIDVEHLETYADLNDIKNVFQQFIHNIASDGIAIMCTDDENIRSLLPINRTIISYGIEHDADFMARDIALHANHSSFTVYTKNNALLGTITLSVAGKHNVYNALAAIALAHTLHINMHTIAQSLASFAGVERRFSFHGTYKNADVFDDYGHHPKEIEHTLTVARKRARNKLRVIFQPHRYTRTQKLWNDFLNVFATSAIDHLIITDIYSAGEYPIVDVCSKRLVEELLPINPSCTIQYIPFETNFASIKHALDQTIEPDDLLLFLGAGKMHLIAQKITQ
ncbi:MAG TPA: UDP-N-acetylmuramate--L-alanine ligase [Candidatus Babeliales bacterium]|nr:UDP-N-acetylmuramate--L-alanine ligase [Candidatus Babeliales bacterium]